MEKSKKDYIVRDAQPLFGTLLKESRRNAGLSQKDLADSLNVTRNTVINWEADKSRPDYHYIPELCRILDIRLHDLFGMEPDSGLSLLEERVVDNLRQMEPKTRRIADKMIEAMLQEETESRNTELKDSFALFLVRPGTVAAGTGDYVPDTGPAYIFLRKNHINARADGIALVNGDSMEPVYHSGDYVYYCNASSASYQEDVIVDTDDGAVIKRVGKDHTLYSVNPAYPYPVKNDQNTVIIRGRVLGVVSSSDRVPAEDSGLMEDLFKDDVRKFRETYVYRD